MDYKKAIIGTSVAALVVFGLFIKNKIEQSQFKPIEKSIVISILKKIKKQNYLVLKQIAMVATQIGNQYKSMDPQMIRTYFNSPESPINIEKNFEDNLQKVCNEVGVLASDFKSSVDLFVKNQDRDVTHWVKEGQKQFQQSLLGKVPQPKVTVPQFLTKPKILQIHQKLALKRYLVQVSIFRKIKDKSQQQLMTDPNLAKEMPNPQEEQIKILQEQGLSVIEDPPKVVFETALARFRNDAQMMREIQRVQKEYQKIFNKYRQKMQTKKITQEELCELEDQLIYSNAY